MRGAHAHALTTKEVLFIYCENISDPLFYRKHTSDNKRKFLQSYFK